MSLSFKLSINKIKKAAFLQAVFFLFFPLHTTEAKYINPEEILKASETPPSLNTCKTIEQKFSPFFIFKIPENYKISHYSKEDESYRESYSKNEIYNIVRVPESGPEWWSIGISFLAVTISLLLPAYQFRKQRNSSINEGFWLREVIFPKLNEIAFKISKEFKKSFELSEPAFTSAYSASLIPLLNELKDTAELLDSFPKNRETIDSINTLCDNLEDNVSNNISESLDVRLGDVTAFHNKLLAIFMKFHLKNV